MREPKFEDVQIVKRVALGEKVTCDLCGYVADDMYPEDMFMPIVISINEGACVSTRVVRDVCVECFEIYLDEPMNELLRLLKENDEELNEANDGR